MCHNLLKIEDKLYYLNDISCFLHLETENSKTLELPFAANQKGLPASPRLSTTILPCQKLGELPRGLAPEEVVKSLDCADLACNRVNVVKSQN